MNWLKQNKSFLLFVMAVIFVLGVWYYAKISLEQLEATDRGTFGDMFGGVNALFSGLAFAGVIYAILLQREELGLQREELIKTRAEFHQQNETLKKQRFENTFFSLMDLHNDIIAALRFQRAGSEYTGRECFLFFYQEFQSTFARISRENPGAPEAQRITDAYNQFFGSWQSYTGHYFRTLYNIVKFVKHSDTTHKQMYMNLLRAQLSVNELALLFYTCLSNLGRRNFKGLVEEFALLENLSAGVLLREDHKDLYARSAFEEQQVQS
ncbi:MAG: putative phage abortive infection protein [Nitrospirota bacterium]